MESGVKQIIIVMQLYKTTPNIHIVCIQKRNRTTNKKKATKDVTIEEEEGEVGKRPLGLGTV